MPVRVHQDNWGAMDRDRLAREERFTRLFDATALPHFLTYHKGFRPHGGLDGDTPLGRLRASTAS
jgi:hypothetical protein